MSQKSSLERAVDEYHKIDSEYRSLLLRYTVLLLSAEVAVIGFLLQNDTTRSLLRTHSLKAFYLLAVSLAAMTIVLSVILKKIERLYEKNNMHVSMNIVFEREAVEVWGRTVKIEPDRKGHEVALQNVKRYNEWSVMLFRSTEITFAVAVLSGALFAILLVINV